MRKIFMGTAIIVILSFLIFLLYNHKQLPTKNDVFHMLEDLSPPIEEVYLVENINGEWLTIYRDYRSIIIARLDQNWLGNWILSDDLGSFSSLVSIDYPALHKDFNWAAGEKSRIASYYFGQINNPAINRIEIETKQNFLEEALIIPSDGLRFFFLRTPERRTGRSDNELLAPVIRGYSETGELIYSTIEKENWFHSKE